MYELLKTDIDGIMFWLSSTLLGDDTTPQRQPWRS